MWPKLSACVGSCFEVVDGVLQLQIDPAGGIACGPSGLTASAVSGDAAAAQAAADAAQASANTALDRVPNKIRWGFVSGTPNAFGTFTFAHGLGGTPASVVLTPFNSGADMLWHLAVENFDSVNVNVKVYKTDTSGFFTTSSFGCYWFAAL